MTGRTSSPDGTNSRSSSDMDRREFMAFCSTIGIGGTAGSVLWTKAQEEVTITKEMLAAAEAVAGLEFDDEERELMLEGLNRNLARYEQIRELDIPNAVHPALLFDPLLPGRTLPTGTGTFRMSRHSGVGRVSGVCARDSLRGAAFWRSG